MSSGRDLVRRGSDVLRPDPSRVITRLFLPGQEILTNGMSRADAVIRPRSGPQRRRGRGRTRGHSGRFRGPPSSPVGYLGRARRADRAPAAIGVGSIRGSAPTTGRVLHDGVRDRSCRLVQPVRRRPSRPERARRRRDPLRHERAGRRRRAHFQHRLPHRCLRRPRSHQPRRAGALSGHRRDETGFAVARVRARRTLRTWPSPLAKHLLGMLAAEFTADDLDLALASVMRDELTRGIAATLIGRIRWIASCNYQLSFPAERQPVRAAHLPARSRRVPRRRGRPFHALHRRRRNRLLLRDLHRVRRGTGLPAPVADRRFPHVQRVATRRRRRAEQGDGHLPAPRRRAVPRADAMGS